MFKINNHITAVIVIIFFVADSTLHVTAKTHRTYLLVGLTGSGKSTLGNCIINRGGDWGSIRNYPFVTSDSSAGCTRTFAAAGNADMMLIDTVGFCDPQFTPEYTLEQLKAALAHVNNQVDAVIFVVRRDRFSNQLVELFEAIQEKVLRGKCRHNSILVITSCQKGWLARDEQRNNVFVQRALESTSGVSFEFALRHDEQDADQEEIVINVLRRQKAINELGAFMDSRQFKKIDLSYVQTPEFDSQMHEVFLPIVRNLAKGLDEIEKGFDKAIDGIKNIGSKIEQGVGKAIDEIKGGFEKAGDGIKGGFHKVEDGFNKVGDAFKSIFG